MQDNDCNTEFLNNVYQNAKMGADSLSLLIDKVDDSNIRVNLQKQQEKYSTFLSKATKELAKRSKTPSETGVMKNIGLWTGVTMNTMIDKTPSHIAEMVIEGCNMGIVDLNKQLNSAKCVEASVKKIGEELLQFEEDQAEEMKTYL